MTMMMMIKYQSNLIDVYWSGKYSRYTFSPRQLPLVQQLITAISQM